MRMRLQGSLVALLLAAPVVALASARSDYEAARARETSVRAALESRTEGALKEVRAAIAAYEAVVRRFPSSGYADNALWQAARLAADAHAAFGEARDRRTAERLLRALVRGYPTSSLIQKAETELGKITQGVAKMTPGVISDLEMTPGVISAEDPRPSSILIRGIQRVVLPEVVRVILELDGEVPFHHERLDSPPRMFVDLKGARPGIGLNDATLSFTDDVVRSIRTGRHPRNTTRVVLDLAGVAQYSLFTLYDPYRLIIDCQRSAAAEVPTVVASAPVTVPEAPTVLPVLPSAPPVAPKLQSAPVSATANMSGGFSLARQLGLGIARIVIDPGHGGHDPGARAAGSTEAEIVLDVALRLEKLLLKEPGIEVVMTRRTDVFIPLDERTAIANRAEADLFLSIHANASRNQQARGVETYFLNFASTPDAEAVAARENAASGLTMSSLTDIVKAIALNTKLDESRDFAALVQRAMIERLRGANKSVRSLGVKQAPFVVLIGAGMPSVLAEVSFLTNRQEGRLLKSGAYRQRIAEALFNAVARYQRILKKAPPVARGLTR